MCGSVIHAQFIWNTGSRQRDRQHVNVSVCTSVTRGWCVDMEMNSHPAGAEPTALYHLHNSPAHSHTNNNNSNIVTTGKHYLFTIRARIFMSTVAVLLYRDGIR